MVVKSDGTKWACMSCLKGHRVSGCTHTDRELVLVPKKGRPVTQCQHCRQERKKRSAHVKCDCGEVEKQHHPREKCIHLREAEERAKACFRDGAPDEKDLNHLAAVAEEQGCCCHHGGKCTCSLLKKEPNTAGALPHGPAVKPRLESTRSEGSITVFQNGHHKPVHRKNHAAHECGMPYKMPLPRHNTDQSVERLSRHSIDSLSSDVNMSFNPTAFAQQMALDAEAGMTRSEHPSPPNYETLGQQGHPNMGPRSVERSHSASSESFGFPTFDTMSIGGDASYEPWALPSADSTMMPNNNPFGVWPTNTDASNMIQPALTAASSGTQSEIDEVPTMDDVFGYGMPSIQEDLGQYSTTNPSSPQSNRRSLPPNFFSQPDFAVNMDNEWPTQLNFGPTDDPKSPRVFETPSSMTFTDPWQVARSGAGLASVSGRPPSHSVGAGSAPGDDLMQQLFPEMDVNVGMFTSSGRPLSVSATAAPGKSYSLDGSNPTAFGDLDDETTFTSQPWTENALVEANDPFTASFDLERDLSNPDFNDAWAQ